jgi:hypothetical protein
MAMTPAQKLGVLQADFVLLLAILDAIEAGRVLTVPWSGLTEVPTTVAGYGITDMASQSVAHADTAAAVPWSGVTTPPATYAPTLATAAAAALTPEASPWTYTNAGTTVQAVTIAGGTVSDIALSQGGALGLTAGQFILRPGDALTVTYTVAPTVANAVDLL